jgi:hypothetical protein
MPPSIPELLQLDAPTVMSRASWWWRAGRLVLLAAALVCVGYLAHCVASLDSETPGEEVLPAMAAGRWRPAPGSADSATLTLDPQGTIEYKELQEGSWSFSDERLQFVDPTPYPNMPGDPPYDPRLDIDDSYWLFTGTLKITDDSSSFYLTAPVTVTLSATSAVAPRRMTVETEDIEAHSLLPYGFPSKWIADE